MARPAVKLDLLPDEETELRRRLRARKTSRRDLLRARIVLLRSEGLSQRRVAEELDTTVVTVNKWSQRFERSGLAGLADRPGRGRKPSIPLETVEQVILKASEPAGGVKQRSTRVTAREVGISHASVARIWRDNDLKPHRGKTFKLSSDPDFAEKFWDVVGLYLDPPERSIVLCCDEKSQIQALERTQPSLPLNPGRLRTHTHDYRRHGTITLFAAMSYLDGKLISRLEKRHTHVQWLRFLRQIDDEVPEGLDVHVVCDNYATHKHRNVKKWLAKKKRFHMHFTPTSSSWLNMVERFFADLTPRLRDGSFRSARELADDIIDRLAEHNLDPKPYLWRKKGAEVLEKIMRARAKLAEMETDA
ncbi:MAG: IS630 family transposase [Deltaproteobacteria bacterium]|nr:IS630 family transposase [Deltaproteobacteria bacterium]